MKKFIGLALLAVSFQISAGERETITVTMFDKSFYDVVQAVNKVCSNSKLELDALSNPDKKISIDFKGEDCAKVIELLTDFNG